MQGQLLFTTVVFILLGHILSSPIPAGSGDATSPDPVYHNHKLEVDSSNSVLGDIPILPDPDVDVAILNRRYVPLRNCKELLDSGFTKSGLYVIKPGNEGGEFVVYCDMSILGGGWTIIQRRLNNKLSFYKTYASYQNGFGDFAENLWLGLDKINRLTANSDRAMELYIGLEAFFGRSTYSLYNTFSVGDEASGYLMKVSGFDDSSTAGNSMFFHNNQRFSAYDRDQDQDSDVHCAETFKGGWWYKDCHKSNLNGMYYNRGENSGVTDGMSWTAWVGDRHSLKSTLIAVR